MSAPDASSRGSEWPDVSVVLLLESNAHDRRAVARTVEEAVHLLTEELGLGS